MVLNREAIAHAVRVTETPEEAADLIARYVMLRDCVTARRLRAEKILSDARKQVADLMKEVICTHDVVKQNPYPSGGRDAEYFCLVCGERLGGSQDDARFT